MFRRIQRFVQSPTGRRVVAWLAPIVVGWIMQKLSSSPKKSSQKSSRRVKNKAK